MSIARDLHRNGDCNAACEVCEWEDAQQAIIDDEQERPLVQEFWR